MALINETIPEIHNAQSVIITAKKFGRIVFSPGKPAYVIIITESVNDGAKYADRIEAGCVPAPPSEPGQTMKIIQALADAVHL